MNLSRIKWPSVKQISLIEFWAKFTLMNLFLALFFVIFPARASSPFPENTNCHSPNNTSSQTMEDHQQSEFKSIYELAKLARIFSSGAVPDEHRQSLPLPILMEGQARISFIFFPAFSSPDKPTELYPPSYVITLSATKGNLVQLLSVDSSYFGIKHPVDEMIGELSLPEGMDAQKYTNKLQVLYELYDTLIPKYYSQNQDSSIASIAKEFRNLFQELSEPPLRAYYRSLGDNFLCWIVDKINN